MKPAPPVTRYASRQLTAQAATGDGWSRGGVATATSDTGAVGFATPTRARARPSPRPGTRPGIA